jgi:hypothetical protein
MLYSDMLRSKQIWKYKIFILLWPIVNFVYNINFQLNNSNAVWLTFVSIYYHMK